MHTYEISILSYAPPASEPVAVGVILYDRATGGLLTKFPDDWSFVSDRLARDILKTFTAYFAQMARERGSNEQALRYLEDTLSNTLRLSPRQQIAAASAVQALRAAYKRFVTCCASPE